MNRQAIRDRILLALNDSPTSPVFWTLEEIDEVIQEGQEVLAEEVEGLKRTAYVPRHDGMQFCSLAAVAGDVMAPYRVWVGDKQHRLQVTTMQHLDNRRERFLETTGTRPDWWYPVSWNLFGIYPALTTGEGYLQVDYLGWPTPLVDDFDEPELPEADHDGLVLYGVYTGLMQQWDMVRALDYFTQFIARWSDSTMRDGVNRMQTRQWRRGERV